MHQPQRDCTSLLDLSGKQMQDFPSSSFKHCMDFIKSCALAWYNHLADVLNNTLQFCSSLADPDLWRKPKVKPNGQKYYAYILVYIDNILVIDNDPKKYMTMYQSSYTVRKDIIKEPDQYLGSNIDKTYFDDGTYAWTMGSTSYVQSTVKNIMQSKIFLDLYFLML